MVMPMPSAIAPASAPGLLYHGVEFVAAQRTEAKPCPNCTIAAFAASVLAPDKATNLLMVSSGLADIIRSGRAPRRSVPGRW